ncbi:hypothetical protein [Paenibacillus turpanensis]|uniref:hypothetical protein n=1 Tax=Paenibacillus turpanensis TaxID=2689078 RepID=UPI00140E411D|nr:hypothetical protein [Paenibacillus turpanensis]
MQSINKCLTATKGPTSKRSYWRGQQGGYTLEAAVVFPIFAVAAVIFIVMIHIAIIEMNVRSALNQAVKLVAVYSYPAAAVMNKTNLPVDVIAGIQEQLPEAVKPLLSAITSPVDRAARDAAEVLIYNHADPKSDGTKRLYRDRLEVSELELPSLFGSGEPMVKMTVQYKVPITLPFFTIDVTLVQTASERAWLGAS